MIACLLSGVTRCSNSSRKWHLETTIWERGCPLLFSYHYFSILSVDITRKYQIFRKRKRNPELILIFSIWSKNTRILFKCPHFIHLFVYILPPYTEKPGSLQMRSGHKYVLFYVFKIIISTTYNKTIECRVRFLDISVALFALGIEFTRGM